MAIAAAVASGNAGDVASEVKNLEVSGFGTPDAAIIFYSGAGTGANPNTLLTLGCGFFDGTNQASGAFTCQHNVSTPNPTMRVTSSQMLTVPNNGAGRFVECTAGWATDGLALTVSFDATGLERFVDAILLKGLTNCVVGNISPGGSSSGSVTGLGFTPNVVLAFATGNTSTDSTTYTTDAGLSFGVSRIDGTSSYHHHCVVVGVEDAGSPTNTHTAVLTSKSVAYIDSANDTMGWDCYFNNFTSGGFDWTASTTISSLIFYLAIEAPNPDDFVSLVVDSATSTGSSAQTGTGMTPDVLITGQTMCASTDTVTAGMAVTLGAVDSSTAGCSFVSDADNLGTTSTSSRHETDAVHIRSDAAALDAVASLTSFDSNGWTWNYSDAAASATKIFALAIGDSTSVGGGPSVNWNGLTSYNWNGVTSFNWNGIT